MSRILILHNGDAAEAMVATALIKKLTSDGHKLTIAGDGVTEAVMRLAGYAVLPWQSADKGDYDRAINLSPSFICTDVMNRIHADEKLGYGQDDSGLFFFNEGAHHHYRAKFIRILTGANQFQLLFGLAGTKWQGEGYCVKYLPRNKTKRTLTGVAIRDQSLREYVLHNLTLGKSRLWRVPIKQNLCKQVDEVNRCKQIVTDDLTVVHVGLALRKAVEFLTPKALPYRLETFGAGSVHVYDPKVLRDDRSQLASSY